MYIERERGGAPSRSIAGGRTGDTPLCGQVTSDRRQAALSVYRYDSIHEIVTVVRAKFRNLLKDCTKR